MAEKDEAGHICNVKLLFSLFSDIGPFDHDLIFPFQRNGILITTYGTIQTSWEELGADSTNRQFTWDYIILDEGHKIKNHTNKTSKVGMSSLFDGRRDNKFRKALKARNSKMTTDGLTGRLTD